MHNTDEIHMRITNGAERFLGELFGERLKSAGVGRWRVGTHGALAIAIADNRLVFTDHETGDKGDAITLWARENSADITTAIKVCAAWAGVGQSGTFVPKQWSSKPPKADAQPYKMTKEDELRAATAARALASTPALCERIAESRQWKPETIKQLATDCALGWDGGCLAFIYETGIKRRWQQDGKRVIRWAVGNGTSFWRGCMRRPDATSRSIICEGETDAIRLIDLGIEDDGKTVVYSVASASTWPADWRKAIVGLDEVIFATDADKAGQQHLPEWSAKIRNHVSKVRSIDWKAVLA